MQTADHKHERRHQPRSRCLKGARIVLANGNSTLACRIRNRSELGVRLTADEAAIVPPLFTLVHDGTTASHQCAVTWRSQTEIGVRIVAATELARQGYNRSTPLMGSNRQPIADRYPV